MRPRDEKTSIFNFLDMKLVRINASELANADLNEREMCRLLGMGEPGCCQCGCHYSATTATNDTANDTGGLTSDPGSQPCCPQPVCDWEPPQFWGADCGHNPQESVCP